MKGLWVAICLLAAVTASASGGKKLSDSARKNPILAKLRLSYKHIFEGIQEDIPYYERMRKRMQDTLAKAKTTRTKKAAKDVIKMFDELIEAEKEILGLFDGSSKQMDIQDAMKRVVQIETRLKAVVTMKRQRPWLTFEEYRLYIRRGWRPKPVREKGVLPFARELWRPPKKEK